MSRVRVLTIVGLLLVALLGMMDLIYTVHNQPEYVALSLGVRFGLVAPIWLAVFISTYLPGHARRANVIYASATVLVCWALAFLKWHTPLYFAETNLLGQTAFDVTLVLLMSFFTLPVRFPWLVGAVLAVVGGISAGFLLTNEGTRFNDSLMLASVLLGVGVLVIVSVRTRENTERRLFAQREQLAELNAELSRLNAEKNEFMTIAAHDLRSPLAALGGAVAGLQSGQIAGAEKVDTTYASIQEMSQRMLGLVDDYLGAHAVEHAKLPVRSERLDLEVAVQTAVRRVMAAARAKRQMVRFDVPTDPVWAEADASLLAQVLDNFLSNALKFSPAGAEIEIGLLRGEDGRRVRIEVVDQGPGIPVAEQSKLFRMFGRTSVQPTAGEKSHGIGLAVTKRLAESMGGAVGCESPVVADGTGAAFWVELRACPS